MTSDEVSTALKLLSSKRDEVEEAYRRQIIALAHEVHKVRIQCPHSSTKHWPDPCEECLVCGLTFQREV